MERRAILATALAGWMLVGGGCYSRAIKEGLGVAVGARGTVTVLEDVPGESGTALGEYKRFELGRISPGKLGSKVPPDLTALLPGEFAKALAAKKIPNASSGKTLLIRGEILHYENASLAQEVFGPLEEVVARVELVDKDTGRVLGVANCVGRTKESVNRGVRAKAEGLAKAVVAWIDKHYPKDQRVRD